jgi:NAD(P)-dependent dehydrogenase (short-subunit alcohol dehydrogenase family)
MASRTATAVVTGAGRGIGLATARRLVADGYDVLMLDRDPEPLLDAARDLGARAQVLDVADAGAVAALPELAGDCAVLVNNAAVTFYTDLLDTGADAARAVLDVNVVGVLLVTRALVPAMAARGGGSVVNLSSITAAAHPPGTGLYSTSKAAVEALTRAFAVELGPLGVRCNAVAPGMVPTEGSAAHYGDERERAARAAVLPLGRLGVTADITAAIAWLCSPEAAWVTGQVLRVDGGYSVAGAHFARLARGSA